MKSVDQKQISKLRKRQNNDILKRMRDGDPLKNYDNYSSWFPPRPVIRKDPKALGQLYSSEAPRVTLSAVSSCEGEGESQSPQSKKTPPSSSPPAAS